MTRKINSLALPGRGLLRGPLKAGSAHPARIGVRDDNRLEWLVAADDLVGTHLI